MTEEDLKNSHESLWRGIAWTLAARIDASRNDIHTTGSPRVREGEIIRREWETLYKIGATNIPAPKLYGQEETQPS